MVDPELIADAEDILYRIRSGDRVALARTITLVESRNTKHRRLASLILDLAMGISTQTRRIAISGSPGVGKSTFIEKFGLFLIERGYRVCVLTVDPSSQISGGSILGDKTRMAQLASHPSAFIRPSATGQNLGGVAAQTREVMFLCEAAGYDIVLVETVGVGQSETEVSSMVDFFVLLIAPGAGDDLQGIKRGIVELADMLVVNKADGQQLALAKRTRAQYRSAMHLLRPGETDWTPTTHLCSAIEGRGMEAVWADIEKFYALAGTSGALEQLRRRQQQQWFQERADKLIHAFISDYPEFKRVYDHIRTQVRARKLSVSGALRELEKHLNLIFRRS